MEMKLNKNSLSVRILLLIIIPITILSVASTIVNIKAIGSSTRTEKISELNSTAMSIINIIDMNIDGDYSYIDGVLYKGDTPLTDDFVNTLDRIYNNTKIETIITKDNTIILNSIASNLNGELILDPEFKNNISSGNTYESISVFFNNHEYLIKSIPLKNSNGDIFGSISCLISREVTQYIVQQIPKNQMMVSAVCTVLTLCIAFTFCRGLRKYLNTIVQYINELSHGIVNPEYDEKLLKRKDEIGSVLKSAIDLSNTLNKIVFNIKEESDTISEIATLLKNKTDISSKTSEEITKAIEEVASNAINQAHASDNTFNIVTNIGSAIGDSLNNVEHANIISKEMTDALTDTSNVFRELLIINNTMIDSINDITTQISSMNKAAQNISGFIDAINSITNQTNLLSLNASIESARAGEAGKGFSVVAGEISKLAKDSAVSANSIQELVSSLEKETSHSVNLMKSLESVVNNQQSKANHTLEELEKLTDNINKTVESLNNITNNSRIISDSKDELLKNVEHLAAISQENAASTEEVNASIESLDEGITAIDRVTDDLALLAVNLKNNVNIFKV